MNIKRAIGFSFMLYIIMLLVFMPLSIMLGPDRQGLAYLIYAMLLVPATLLLAKWFFKAMNPTWQRGLVLGIITIVVSLLLDGLMVAGMYFAGESLADFTIMYTSWEFYAALVWLVLITTFAGWEFDGTYSEDK